MLKLQFRGNPGNFVKLSVSTVTIGRDEGNDFIIDSPSVSDFHAEISTDMQHPSIIDLLSKTGTFVNEHRITGPRQLKAWDIIRLGTVELEVIDPNSRRPQDWALSTESDLLASQFHTLLSETVVGRDPACDLAIDSNLLSRRHAKLVIEGDHLRVIDLQSENGTYINGQKIDEGKAYPGDELKFDRQRFVVVGPSPAEPGREEAFENQTRPRSEFDLTAVELDEPVDTAASGSAVGGDTIFMNDEETRFFTPPPTAALLTELDAIREPRQFRLDNDPSSIGRGKECDFVLDDKSVSKQHAQFVSAQGNWVLSDLGSSNGVLVNGSRVDEVALKSGDRIQLGRCTFEYALSDELPAESDPRTMLYQGPKHESMVQRALPAKAKSRVLDFWPWLVVLLATGLLLMVAAWYLR